MTLKGNVMARMHSATKKAFQKVASAGNVESDPDLALYGTLKPEHFTELMKTYGEEPIIDYIREMESKKIMNGRNK
jgi:hypothetical protein